MNRTSVWEPTVDGLCSTPGGFQKNLETALHRCERMNFLSLLEDPDSLACHDTNCKDHVAAMLQVLNRTLCVVFLTANNPGLIPPHLRSRCDKIVHLPELSRTTRRRAWLKAFNDQGITQHILNRTQLDTALNMAEKPKLNGHEIVNLVKQVPMRAIAGFNCDGDGYVNELGGWLMRLGM
jgi:SpoVK/Ycf46/Vps4 family AAA+-type ATPase